MPNNTVYNNRASSNIVYLYGAVNSGQPQEDDCCCPFSVVEDREDLSLISDPQNFDVTFIQNGSNGGTDIAIFLGGQWIIKSLKGAKGDKGEKGDTGDKGERGEAGQNGLNGANGQTGLAPEHRWKGTKLQFKLPDGSWGTLVDLRGQDGTNGTNGTNGAKGDKPNHEWNGTELRFELPNGTWGVSVDLRGERGEKGDFPAHEWSATNEIRFQNPDGSWGAWQNIRGEKGDDGQNGIDGLPGTNGTNGVDGLAPEHEIGSDNRSIRFKNPDGSWGAWVVLTSDLMDGGVVYFDYIGLELPTSPVEGQMWYIPTYNRFYEFGVDWVVNASPERNKIYYYTPTNTLYARDEATGSLTILAQVVTKTSQIENDGEFGDDKYLQVGEANTTYQKLSEKGVPNGYVPLDSLGKILSDYLVLVDDLITGGNNALLSAEQGKVLKEQIDAINLIITSDDINLDTVQELVDAIKEVETSLGTILVNDLTTGGVTKALTAEMGKTLKDLIDALSIKPTSVQNGVGVEQFTTLDVLKFSNVSFNPATKTIEVNPLVPLSAFLDPINGSDINGVIENANRPFKTIQALLTALPATTGETYTIYITGGTINFTKKIIPRNLIFSSYKDCVFDFSSMTNDDTTPLVEVFELGQLSIWDFKNNNISINCNYNGVRYLKVTSTANSVSFKGFIKEVTWKVAQVWINPIFKLGVSNDIVIGKFNIDSYGSLVMMFGQGNGNIKINTINLISTSVSLSNGDSATYSFGNIIQGNTTNKTFTIKTGKELFVKGDINFNGTLKCFQSPKYVFDVTVNPVCTIEFVDSMEVSGKINSSHFMKATPTDGLLYLNNLDCKLLPMNLFNTASVVIDSCKITYQDYFIARTANHSLVECLTIRGFNTLTHTMGDGEMCLDASTAQTGVIISNYGTLKTTAKTLGSKANEIIMNATFKEKKNEIVVRSKKDIVNRVLSSETNYIIDGILNDFLSTDRIIVPVGGLSLSGYGFDVSALKATQNNSVLFESPVGGCGNLFLSNISLEASGTGSKVFNLTNAGAPTGGADAIELNVVNFDNCTSLGELTNFRQGLWDNIGVFGCKDGLTLSGTWSGGFRSDLVIVRNFGVASVVSTLFKKGTDLVFQSRFLTDINADFKVGGLLSNFDASNFLSNKLYQIKGAILTRGKVIDSTDNYTDTLDVNSSVCDWFGNIGLPNAGQVAYTDIEVNDPSKGLVLTSPDGTKFRMTVDNLGVTTITAI